MNKNNLVYKLHQESVVVDTHCDTLTAMITQERRLGSPSACGHLDLPRLKAGGVNVQFFAAFIAPEYKEGAMERAVELINLFKKEICDNQSEMMLVKNSHDINTAIQKGKIAAVLAVEGGESLEGKIDSIRLLYDFGVRCLTLTWDLSNELGVGVGDNHNPGGLTPFGYQVVKEMNQLGMLVDVSHMSERTFWDVLDTSTQPVIASHSNCRELFNHHRNLDNKQIRALSEQGGVIGITFVPAFLSSENASVKNVLDHIDYAVTVGGIDCVCLGSDFDGTDELPVDLEDCTALLVLTEGLIERGYNEEEIKKILGQNILRVIGQVLK